MWKSGALEWNSANQIQTRVAIFQELKYFCLTSSTCEYRDPNMADSFQVFRISFNLLISDTPCIF